MYYTRLTARKKRPSEIFATFGKWQPHKATCFADQLTPRLLLLGEASESVLLALTFSKQSLQMLFPAWLLSDSQANPTIPYGKTCASPYFYLRQIYGKMEKSLQDVPCWNENDISALEAILRKKLFGGEVFEVACELGNVVA